MISIPAKVTCREHAPWEPRLSALQAGKPLHLNPIRLSNESLHMAANYSSSWTILCICIPG